MLRATVNTGPRECFISHKNRRVFKFFAYVAIIESMFAFAMGATILDCMWKVKSAMFEFDTLARIAYLYDLEACDVVKLQGQQFTELDLSNDTRGFDVVPIKRLHATVPRISRTSAAMRRNMQVTMSLHLIWTALSALTIFTVRGSLPLQGWKRTLLTLFYYSYVGMCLFDSFMAVNYIAHIRQSLTKGMVIRYSGWKNINVANYDDFAGWLSVAASMFWLRGVLIFALNVYGCSRINAAIHTITIREVSQRVDVYGNVAIPDPLQEYKSKDPVLYIARRTSMP